MTPSLVASAQPSDRALDERVDPLGHLGPVRADLDRDVLFLTVDLVDGSEAGVAGSQFLALVTATSDDEPLRESLDLGRAIDLNAAKRRC